MMHDVIIVGGSFAGLSAALQLARTRRKVLVVDLGLRRNRFAAHSNGFLGQDGKAPGRIIEEARFIDPEVYRAYYDSFGRAYVVQLQRAQAKGEIGPGDPEVRAWALMGMAIKLGERFVLWEDKPDIDHVVEDAFALMRDGLSP